jgi:hypothetical protein
MDHIDHELTAFHRFLFEYFIIIWLTEELHLLWNMEVRNPCSQNPPLHSIVNKLRTTIN